ncbi:MAG: hypothetical protein RMZ41_031760 [Nostoc sp. DedVER02]|uniref:hypothetical protein n=1 Tax=unclassified Nostoc TaxID=2593658 RepID=UPI002AD21EE2|nr:MULTISPECIES: hypothetical protein [unclassified Nostoc]MDZ7984372.1 hypothetical protein [Nostoc sp. DedVER02]MDZ8111425.1 hypothetical protein [Nostoc sp. DedVER01b]
MKIPCSEPTFGQNIICCLIWFIPVYPHGLQKQAGNELPRGKASQVLRKGNPTPALWETTPAVPSKGSLPTDNSGHLRTSHCTMLSEFACVQVPSPNQT